MFAVTIALSVLLAHLAQDPMPTPIPTPAGGSCGAGIEVIPLPLKEGDISIHCEGGPFLPSIYAIECLSQDSNCQADRVLGYGVAYICGRLRDCANISLSRPLRSGEYIALYGPTSNLRNCLWNVYRVYATHLPRQYLPLLLK